MIYQSQVYVSARQSEAITVLNQLRHILTGRKQTTLSNTETQLFRQAIDAPSYTFLNDLDEYAPVVELSHAIHQAAGKLDEDTRASTLASFKTFLDGSSPEPETEGRRALVTLVERSMDRIAQPAGEPALCM